MNSDFNLIEEVKKDIQKYGLLHKGAGVIAGISGGADSVCLLKVLKELKDEFRLRLTAVHVNHGLRGEEADKDQAYVEELCGQWEIPLRIFREDIKSLSRQRKISEEEAGREIRYGRFEQVMNETGSSCVAVAHQREDQAETIVLHIFRGTGLDGLCGMSMKQGRVIRPLLNISRDQILRFLSENNISYRTDSSNLTNDYARNRVRNVLFPMMREMFAADPVKQITKLSYLLKNDRDFLNLTAGEAFENILISDSENVEISLKKLNNYHEAIAKRIIRIVWERINKTRKNLEQIHVDEVYQLCRRGTTGKRVILPNGFEARLSYDRLIFSKRKAASRRVYAYPIVMEGITRADEAGGFLSSELLSAEEAFLTYGPPETIRENSHIQLFDYDKLKSGIILRDRKEGDRIRPYGSGGKKKLKEYFIDQKIPREERSGIPLVASGNQIVWVVGRRTSAEFRAQKSTGRVLALSWHKLKY